MSAFYNTKFEEYCEEFFHVKPGTICRFCDDDIDLFYEIDHIDEDYVYTRFEVLHDGSYWNVEYNHFRYGKPNKRTKRSFKVYTNLMQAVEFIEEGVSVPGYKECVHKDCVSLLGDIKEELNNIERKYLTVNNFINDGKYFE